MIEKTENLVHLYLYTMELYSATKNEIFSFSGKLMEPENIILNEVS
jgi:hypothetical protein